MDDHLGIASCWLSNLELIWVEFLISPVLRGFLSGFSGFPPLKSTARSIQGPHWYQQLMLKRLYPVEIKILLISFIFHGSWLLMLQIHLHLKGIWNEKIGLKETLLFGRTFEVIKIYLYSCRVSHFSLEIFGYVWYVNNSTAYVTLHNDFLGNQEYHWGCRTKSLKTVHVWRVCIH